MSLSTQFLTLIHMLLAGIYLGAIFDTFYRLRGQGPASWLKTIEDLLFWVINAVLVFLWLQAVNQGQMRVSVLVALACGYLLYRSLLAVLYLKILNGFLGALAALYRGISFLVTRLIFWPIQFIFKIVFSVLLFCATLLVGLGKWLISPVVTWLTKRRENKNKEGKKGFLKRVANRFKRKK